LGKAVSEGFQVKLILDGCRHWDVAERGLKGLEVLREIIHIEGWDRVQNV